MLNLIKKIVNVGFLNIKIFIFEHRYIFKCNKYKLFNLFLQELVANNKYYLTVPNKKHWINKLIKLTYAFPDLKEVGLEFVKCKIKVEKEIYIKENELLVICVEKNDIIKMKKFLEHYRKLGVNQFIILDNNSNDGTFEFLYSQNDVFLLSTIDTYTTNRREAWINRILAYFGENRWYLIADSDEFLVYNNCENKSLHDLIDFLDNNRIDRCRALMVDMYGKPEYYLNGKKDNFLEECKFMDKNTYIEQFIFYLDLIVGGPRARIFGQNVWLTKYPLFYLKSKDIECKSHFLFPLRDNVFSKCYLVLKHYKFLPGELEKYKKIANVGNYYNNSSQYKQYVKVLEKEKGLNFINSESVEYEDSNSLRNISIYDFINWT